MKRLAIITLAATAAAASTAFLATGALADKAAPHGAAPHKASPLGAAPPVGTGLPAGQCIRTSDIKGHTIVDDRTMLIDVNGRATYRLTMHGSCLAGALTSDPVVTRKPPGTEIACKPIDFDIAISKDGFPLPCIVDSVVKLSPAEVAALPPKLRP